MKTEVLFKPTILAASIALITACSGGSSTPTADGTTTGVITGFGSIYINGVEYETDTASIDIDGTPSQETALGVGDVCQLQGSVNADGTTGTATAVYCSDELEGYVLDVSGLGLDGTGTINVMGQTVTVTADTVFNSDAMNSVNDLVANDIVEVSGFSDGAGRVVATRIETKNAAEDVEVKGLVSTLDDIAMTFSIGGLSVDYSSATETPAGLANGLYVEVKTETTLTGDIDTGFTMIASKVEIEDDGDMDIDGDEGDEIEVQGVVSDITDTSFRFNGTLVEFASLEIDEDFSLASLVDGMIITVEGYIDANGNFVVEEIEKDHGSEFEVKGSVTDKSDTTVTLTVDSASMTFSINNDTRMIDSQDDNGILPLHYFSLADVAIGDFVEIEYYVDDASGSNIATELEREDAPSI
ncbi:MAG: DUF5666 domain-containing protein [Gammaproteobacteria bacterium]|nr:DUF5666 domain-containing protein [Gammaproteobacteria bacterium]